MAVKLKVANSDATLLSAGSICLKFLVRVLVGACTCVCVYLCVRAFAYACICVSAHLPARAFV